MEFKDILKNLRKEKGLTQEQLASSIGVSEITIRSYEAGRREPNSQTMVALEEYFNVSGSYLRGETEIREPMIWDDTEIMSDFEKDFLISMKSLSDVCLKQTDKNKKLLFDFFVEFRCLINSVDNDDDLTTITDIMTKNSNALERLIKNK
jgi:transcriptional regulator with XRE-family HTH domain